MSYPKSFKHVAYAIFAGIAMLSSAPCLAAEAFRFEQYPALDDMRRFIESTMPLGTSREHLRTVFVTEGKATLTTHPTAAGVEKYLYDINLCRYHIWRWNISADFDAQGKLLQSYVNGELVFANGTPKKDPKDMPSRSGKSAILKVSRQRPLADKGESVVSAVILDKDGDPQTTDDQFVAVGGPTRADALNMGNLHAYTVEAWRSIFDGDNATMATYGGDCKAVDALQAEELKKQKP